MLPDETQKAWDCLKSESLLSDATLIGGTALALRIRHRLSEDLDFIFTTPQLPRIKIDFLVKKMEAQGWSFLRNDNPGAEDEFVNAGMNLHDYQQDFILNGTTKLTFFTAEREARLLLDSSRNEGGPRVAEMGELFDLKAIVSAVRSKTRDWLDLFILMRDHGYGITDYAQAFVKAQNVLAFDIGLNRLCSGIPSASDEGYFSLMENPPELSEITQFFRIQRDLYEQKQAEIAQRELYRSGEELTQ